MRVGLLELLASAHAGFAAVGMDEFLQSEGFQSGGLKVDGLDLLGDADRLVVGVVGGAKENQLIEKVERQGGE